MTIDVRNTEQYIRAAAARRGMTLGDLCEALGTNRNSLKRRYRNPRTASLGDFVEIGEALGMTPAEVMDLLILATDQVSREIKAEAATA